MSDIKEIKTALISVFHKDGLDEILRLLDKSGVKFLSTGGTRDFITGLGYECQAVEALTAYPTPPTTPPTRSRPDNMKYPRSTW